MPIIPFFIFFSSFALYRLLISIRNKKVLAILSILVAIFVLNAVSFLNPLGITAPNYAETYYAIAKNFVARSYSQHAHHYYQLAIQEDPKNISAINDLGVLFLNEGDYLAARQYFERALKIDPEAEKPKLNLQLCQNLTMKNQKK